MKSIKYIALSAILTFSAICAVVYTSCKKDACKDVTCLHGGVCSDGNCITCDLGYEGANCATLMRDKFIGTYSGTELCTTGNDTYTITLATNSDDLKLTYSNLYNNTPAITATCVVTATDQFSFSGSQGTIVFSGTGKLVGNQLTVTYTIDDGTNHNSCVFTGNK